MLGFPRGRARALIVALTAVLAVIAITAGGIYLVNTTTEHSRHDRLETELRTVAERYVDAINHADGARLADLTMGQAYDDISFDQRSHSQYHLVDPYIWVIRTYSSTNGNAVIRQFTLLTHSDDIAVARVSTRFEHDRPNAVLPQGIVMFVFQRVNGTWRISATPQYYYSW